jgi:cytochrome P450
MGQQVTVSMANSMVEMDETLFPDPHHFNPDRWLQKGKDVERWVVAFSGGPRRCPGMK